MNENKTKHKSAYIGSEGINAVEEITSCTKNRKSLFGEPRNLSQPALTVREAAKLFVLSKDFKNFKAQKTELTPEQKEIQRYFDDNNIGLRIKESIESFEASKNT
ncbi:hypothetical protein ABEX78_21625 [Priestia megaterium]